MHGNHCLPPILMFQKVMASAYPYQRKSGADKDSDELISPNLMVRSVSPSTSRHSSMASRMRSFNSSSERACVWQPGSDGKEAT
jgi:hypothetical protein